MKKLWIPLVILLIWSFIIAGCGTSSSTTAPATTAPSVTTSATVKPTTSTTTPTVTTPAATTSTTTKPAATTPSTSQTVSSPTTTTKAQYGGRLRWVEASAPGAPIGYPGESGGGGNQYALQPFIKEQLGGTFAPCLATSYDIVTDLKNPSITLHLRKGVKFQDGTDFNAQAAKWNMDATIAAGINRSSTDAWKSIEVVDDYTLKFNFVSWSNRVIRTFSSGTVFMVSPTAFQKNGIDWMRWHMVGTGPFVQIGDFKRDVGISFEKFKDYWEQGKPYVDTFNQLFVADELTRLALFKSGGADMLSLGDNGRQANELQAAGFQIIKYSVGATALIPDSAHADSPWSNLKVRQAAEYAIDKDAIVNAFGYGNWKTAYQLNSPANMAYDSNIESRKYDVSKSKQLLSEAGYPNGFKTKVILQNTFNKDIAVAIQSYLNKVGIQTDLELAEASKFNTYMLGEYKNALLLTPLQEWANPNNQLVYYWGTPGTYFKNSVAKPDGWADMIAASLITSEPDKATVQKAERIQADNVMAIPIYYGASLWALTDQVHDTGLGTRGNAAWWEPQNAWLSK
jgi:peptide/nickel transport system substrate-binding protein